MLRTYGTMPTSLPAGMFKAVRFPVLAMLDKTTGDHRRLASAGANVRSLPLQIRGQFKVSFGHDGADVTGALHEVTIDPESGVMSGRGFLADDEFGRRHAKAIHLKMMKGNSVDLAEVKARLVEEQDSEEWYVEFTDFNVAATTGVGTPAFAEAFAEVDPLSDEELMASLGEDPMVELVADFGALSPSIFLADRATDIAPEAMELLASGATVQPYEAFFHPESDHPQKIIVDENGHVYGHLALWDKKHDGIQRPTYPPRPPDGYASFNKPGVLTDRGIVNTGPIFAYGGHRRANGQPDLDAAYGGIENTWCDVRISEGVFGPWLSGIVRPGTDDTTVYAARASRISGHWPDGRHLKAIVSVNAEGFDVPGNADELGMELAAGFAFHTDAEGRVCELVASFSPPAEPEETLEELQAKIEELVKKNNASLTLTKNVDEVELAQRRQLLLALLAAEDDD